VNTAATQAGGGSDLSNRPPSLMSGPDSPEALTGSFVEPCGRRAESGLQFLLLPDTLSACFASFHKLSILVYDGGVQEPRRERSAAAAGRGEGRGGVAVLGGMAALRDAGATSTVWSNIVMPWVQRGSISEPRGGDNVGSLAAETERVSHTHKFTSFMRAWGRQWRKCSFCGQLLITH
jgi:hypothetical protein